MTEFFSFCFSFLLFYLFVVFFLGGGGGDGVYFLLVICFHLFIKIILFFNIFISYISITMRLKNLHLF